MVLIMNNNDIVPILSDINFSLEELNKLYGLCNSELINLVGKKVLFVTDRQYPSDQSSPYMDALTKQIDEYSELKKKLFNYIHNYFNSESEGNTLCI